MKPHVVMYNAVSLDSRFDWFSPDIGLFYEQVHRWNEDATLVGSETLLNPPEPMPEDIEEDIPIPDIDSNDKRAVLIAADSRGSRSLAAGPRSTASCSWDRLRPLAAEVFLPRSDQCACPWTTLRWW